ncbi:MAG: protein kinase [Candidatus Riflebacteria bacterium]|nr:protein kinase [Candidatus Riflebacteria bacterium]
MTTPVPSVTRLLFIDVVGFSKKSIHVQKALIETLTAMVAGLPAFRALPESDRVALPTGDGMAIGFWSDPPVPLEAAIQLQGRIKDHNQAAPPSMHILVRMGINTGEVFTIVDINRHRNVVGDGINNAQRVMDFGDAWHLLASETVADELAAADPRRRDLLHFAGTFADKHGGRHRIYNVYSDTFGNPTPPTRGKVPEPAGEAGSDRHDGGHTPLPPRMAAPNASFAYPKEAAPSPQSASDPAAGPHHPGSPIPAPPFGAAPAAPAGPPPLGTAPAALQGPQPAGPAPTGPATPPAPSREAGPATAAAPFLDRILALAAWEVRFLQHAQLGPDHLFLALTKLEDGRTGPALAAQGLDPTELRRGLRQLLGRGSRPTPREIPSDAAVTELLDSLRRLARTTGRDTAERDLALGLFTLDPTGRFLPFLTSRGFDQSRFLEAFQEGQEYSSQVRSLPAASPDPFASTPPTPGPAPSGPRPTPAPDSAPPGPPPPPSAPASEPPPAPPAPPRPGATLPGPSVPPGSGSTLPQPDLAEATVPADATVMAGPPPGSVRVILTVEEGPAKGRRFTFAEPEAFIVGRSPEANFTLGRDDHAVSRKHFLVEVVPPRCYLKDFGSLNGTFVNGRRVDRVELSDGDLVNVGMTFLRVRLERSATPAAAVCPRCGQAFLATAGDPRPPATGGPPLCRACQQEEELAAAGREARTRTRVAATCLGCAADLSAGANDDGRGVELDGVATYLCPACAKAWRRPVEQDRIDRFEILQELGKGGMGVVYLARDPATCRLGALKMVLLPNADAAMLGRFRREMKIMERLVHPNVVRLYDQGEVHGCPWFVSEFLPGGNAAQLLTRTYQGPLPVGVAARLIQDVLAGLAYFHETGGVHRDIKPANILLPRTTDGAPGPAKLADFGLAKGYTEIGGATLTRPNEFAGSIFYTAPEQILYFKKAGATADLYSLGVALYELVSGKFPFDFPTQLDTLKDQLLGRQTRDPLLVVLEDPAIPLRERAPTLPAGLAAVVDRAIQRDPARRFPSAGEFAAALAGALP